MTKLCECVFQICVTKRGAEEEDDKVACARFVCDRERRGGGGGKERRDTEPKTRTPHKDVEKKEKDLTKLRHI